MASDLILLVEDDPDDEELAIASLQKHHIGRIRTVRDGVEALEYRTTEIRSCLVSCYSISSCPG